MLDYCWQCGTLLTDISNAGQFYQGAPPTQNYVVPNQGQGYSTYGQNGAPQYQPRRSSISFGRVALVLSGIFFVLFLIAGAGAAVVYKVVSRPPVPRYEDDYRYRNPEPVKPSPAVKENPVKDRSKSDKPSAEFEKIWVDYNVRENGRLGMRIHVKFTVYNMKDVDSYLAVYFEKSDGTKLKSTNKKFASKDGQVAVFRSLKPGYVDTVYKDLEVFMPYEELKLGKGKYDLKMDADVIYEKGDLVEHLGYYDFQYEKN
jgi:hypothetical protein